MGAMESVPAAGGTKRSLDGQEDLVGYGVHSVDLVRDPLDGGFQVQTHPWGPAHLMADAVRQGQLVVLTLRDPQGDPCYLWTEVDRAPPSCKQWFGLVARPWAGDPYVHQTFLYALGDGIRQGRLGPHVALRPPPDAPLHWARLAVAREEGVLRLQHLHQDQPHHTPPLHGLPLSTDPLMHLLVDDGPGDRTQQHFHVLTDPSLGGDALLPLVLIQLALRCREGACGAQQGNKRPRIL